MLKKQVWILILCLISVLFLAACDNSIDNPPEQISDTPLPTTSVEPITSIKPNELSEIMIYKLEPDTYEISAVVVLVSSASNVTPQFIVSQVIVNLGDANIDIGLNDVYTKEDIVYVDFISGTAPSIIAEKELENSVLSVIGQSIIDNLIEYKKVVFRLDGEAYVSTNFSFDKDYVFIER